MEMIAWRLLSTSMTSDKRQWKTTTLFRQDCQWTRPFRKESLDHPIEKEIKSSKVLVERRSYVE